MWLFKYFVLASLIFVLPKAGNAVGQGLEYRVTLHDGSTPFLSVAIQLPHAIDEPISPAKQIYDVACNGTILEKNSEQFHIEAV